MNFDAILAVNEGRYQRPLPLRNSFGPVYPVLHDELLANLLQIAPHERVLDIGGGSQPFARANVVTEAFLEDSAHRSGRPVPAGVDFVECFAEQLPFADQAFDVAISRQVFEHTRSPADACREIMRVASRGFIETPRKELEVLLGANPSHNWFVSVVDNTLIFERRRFIRHAFRNPNMSALASAPEGQWLLHWEFKNLSNVQFAWTGDFRYEVIDAPGGFDYSNPDHASEAHLDVAICGLRHGGFFLPARESDARTAVRLRPRWALARHTLGIILWKQGQFDEARQEFELAAAWEPREEFRRSARLLPGEEPTLVDFEDILPMDQAYFDAYRTPWGIDLFRLLQAPKPPSRAL